MARSDAVYAGRDALLTELHQYLNAPAAYALSIQAIEGLGRSTLLRQLAMLDARFVSVVLPITLEEVAALDDWLATLAAATLQALQREDMATARLPAPPTTDLPDWMRREFLPAVGQHVRQQARVIWLLDDVQCLAQAISQGTIPPDHPAYLLELLLTFPFLSLLTSADEDSPQLEVLRPLVQPQHVVRLSPLPQQDCATMLGSLLGDVPPALAERVWVETGGMPRQINDIAQAIQRGAALNDAVQHAYTRAQPEFHRRWKRLPRDERVVLTAIIHLIAQRPQRPPTPADIELWLAQSDTPLGSTAVAAQLRGLEFRHILRPQRSAIALHSALMERWLLEHARDDAPAQPPPSRAALLLGMGVLLALAVAVALVIASLPAAGAAAPPPLPTLPLGS